MQYIILLHTFIHSFERRVEKESSLRGKEKRIAAGSDSIVSNRLWGGYGGGAGDVVGDV